MKHKAIDWISDICLCGKKFKDRMEFYRHASECKDHKLYREGSGATTL